MNHLRRLLCLLTLIAPPLLALTSCALPDTAHGPAAQLDRLQIVSRAPAFGGASFDAAGDYETIVAVAHMHINVRHASNQGIVDLDRAAAPGGSLAYRTDVVIVRPRDPAKASRVLLFDLPSRGGKLFQRLANEGSEDIAMAAGVGTGFTMRRGHTLVWIGWQGDIALAADGSRAGTDFPGVPLHGDSSEEAVFDDIAESGVMRLSYAAASQDQSDARLTVRASAAAAPTTLPASAWRYTGPTGIAFARAKGFDAGAIYRFQYRARDPKVMGLGMAAVRDVASYLKSGALDGAGQANPLADIRPDLALVVGVGQGGRFLRELIWQGFNADPRGGKVFDGAMPLLAGSGKSFVNARFARPDRVSTQHLDQLTPGDQFPFTYAVSTDPVGGKTDGIFARCRQDASCPKLMHVDSSGEFWQARASLVVTDGAGRDLALPDDVRAYLMSSTQHLAAASPTVGVCKYPSNPASQAPLVRALLDRLVAWTRDGREPPASRYPRLADARLTAPQREAVGFPDLSRIGVAYPETINALALTDYAGPTPQVDPARRYEILVPMADLDGHDIAGVRLPDVAVPLATYAGWNVRRRTFAEGQLCGLNGMNAPFAATPRAGDPRQAISQRYRTRLEYAKAVAVAARALRDQGLLLDDDVTRYIERAKMDARVAP